MHACSGGTVHLALALLSVPGAVRTGATAAVLALVLALGGPCAVCGAIGGSLRNLSQRWVTVAAMVVGGALTAGARLSDIPGLGWAAVCVNLLLATRAAAAQWWARGVADMPENYRELLQYVGLLRDGACAAMPAPDEEAFDREIDRRREARRQRRLERVAASEGEGAGVEDGAAEEDRGPVASEAYTNTLPSASGSDPTV